MPLQEPVFIWTNSSNAAKSRASASSSSPPSPLLCAAASEDAAWLHRTLEENCVTSSAARGRFHAPWWISLPILSPPPPGRRSCVIHDVRCCCCCCKLQQSPWNKFPPIGNCCSWRRREGRRRRHVVVRGRENSTEDEQSEAAPRTPSTLLEGSMPRDSSCGAMPAFLSSLSLYLRAQQKHANSNESPPHPFTLPVKIRFIKWETAMCIPLPPSPMFPIFHPRSLLGIQVGARFNTASQHDFRTLQTLILVLCKQALFLAPCKLWFLILCKPWLWWSASKLCFW